ncbi:MAG: polysaccharide deacetylase family protein [Cyanobacteria bacterium J06623_4]
MQHSTSQGQRFGFGRGVFGVGIGLLTLGGLSTSLWMAAQSARTAGVAIEQLKFATHFLARQSGRAGSDEAGLSTTTTNRSGSSHGQRTEYLPALKAALISGNDLPTADLALTSAETVEDSDIEAGWAAEPVTEETFASFAQSSAASCLLPETTDDWMKRLGSSARRQLAQWKAVYASRSHPTVWPELHYKAREAKVPVVMYHDVLPEKEVFFDVTIEELEADFLKIKEQGLTPISMARLVSHLRTGAPLPEKPIVLTFDDGYVGHYDHVFDMLKRYGYPVAFSVFTGKPDGEIVGRSTLSWQQLEEMAAHPLVTIVSHSVTHPSDLTQLSDEELEKELTQSKQRLEEKLGIPIRYFTYPEGNHDERVVEATKAAGYEAALIMDNWEGQFAGRSEDLLTLERFGESRFDEVIETAWGGPPLVNGAAPALDLTSPIVRSQVDIDEVPMTLIAGGRLKTIHADSRYPLTEIVADSNVVAAVDGTFFSLEFLDSNIMIGPVLGQNSGEFHPGSAGDIDKLTGRPLVLVGPQSIQFIAFDPDKHNTLEGIQAEMPNVTDAFVGAAWLVRDQQHQSASTFKNLFAYEEARFRAFWGINHLGQPVVGATQAQVDSVGLGQRLAQAGFQTAVMLDSGLSTSLVYEGESQMIFESRPVPHALVLVPEACEGEGYEIGQVP